MINNMLAITLQNCVAEIGFMPDDKGAFVKRILAIEDEFDPAKLALGMYLDDCLKSKSYAALERAMIDMKDA